MAALALMTAACSNDDNDFAQQPQKAEGITITAQLAPKTNGATTRAVSDGGNKIVSEWAENEHIAILYEVSSTKYVADATITAVDGSGTATITFTVEAGTANDTPCTLVYPLSAAKADHSGVKDAATLLGAQDGTLNANLDVRVGEGTIQTTTPGLTVTTQPVAQFAIFKFTVKNADASATIDVKPLTITIGAQNYVITPASATSELFVALPAITSQAVTFTATGNDSNNYIASKPSVTFTAGNYYQSVIKMAAAPSYPLLSAATTADYGKVVCAAGHLHTAKTAVPAGCTAVGILGKVTETGHGLILALQDATPQTWDAIFSWAWPTYAGTRLRVLPDDAARGVKLTSYTALGATAVSNWAVAPKSDYEAIFTNLGSTGRYSNGLTYDDNVNAYITGAGGAAFSQSRYWSATWKTDYRSWYFYKDYWSYDPNGDIHSVRPVLGF